MGRPRKYNQLPTTTMRVDIELVEQLQKLKKRNESLNDFLRRLMNDYADLDDSLKIMRELYHKKVSELENYKKVNKLQVSEITIENKT